MRMRQWLAVDHLPAAAAVLAMLAAVAVAHGQTGPDGGPPGGGPPDDGAPFGGPPHRMIHHRPPTTGPAESATPISGTVEAYNRDPRGRVNGLVLKSGDHLVQLNTPPDWAGSLEKAAPLNDTISATAVPEVVVGDRTIEQGVSLDGHGVTLRANGPGEAKTVHVEGAVAQLNYSPRGELDGALLDTGDFVHLGPPGAARIGLATGQKLSVDGRAEPMADGHQAIDAETVNGKAIPHPPHPRQEARGGFGPGMRPMHGGPGGSDRDGPDRDGPGGDSPDRDGPGPGPDSFGGPARPDDNRPNPEALPDLPG